MIQQRWLRIIPVALIMYTISYVDRTNVSLALDPKISHLMRDLLMDDRMKGRAAGVFFLGYVLLQISGGHLAGRWSAKKWISLCLIFWGACAVGCGLSETFAQFGTMRFLLGVAEGGVYPATVVLLAHWFPRSERARANALWNLCQPLAVVASAPITGWLLGALRKSLCTPSTIDGASIRASGPSGIAPDQRSLRSNWLGVTGKTIASATWRLPAALMTATTFRAVFAG